MYFLVYKFKNEEYAFDRRMRTLLEPTANALFATGLSLLQLRVHADNLAKALHTSLTNDFLHLDEERALKRIRLMPYILAFLERHQQTIYCSNFSDHFTHLVSTVESTQQEYAF